MTVPKWRAGEIQAISLYNPAEELAKEAEDADAENPENAGEEGAAGDEEGETKEDEDAAEQPTAEGDGAGDTAPGKRIHTVKFIIKFLRKNRCFCRF